MGRRCLLSSCTLLGTPLRAIYSVSVFPPSEVHELGRGYLLIKSLPASHLGDLKGTLASCQHVLSYYSLTVPILQSAEVCENNFFTFGVDFFSLVH